MISKTRESPPQEFQRNCRGAAEFSLTHSIEYDRASNRSSRDTDALAAGRATHHTEIPFQYSYLRSQVPRYLAQRSTGPVRCQRAVLPNRAGQLGSHTSAALQLLCYPVSISTSVRLWGQLDGCLRPPILHRPTGTILQSDTTFAFAFGCLGFQTSSWFMNTARRVDMLCRTCWSSFRLHRLDCMESFRSGSTERTWSVRLHYIMHIATEKESPTCCLQNVCKYANAE